ncbi:MAG: GNAT family N-acetyltransferase [Roseburia sp.]|nr:GNAT family N-acetyltransferase [Roseburia sp.]
MGKMTIEIKEFTEDKIEDAVRYERALRAEEDFYGWEIDDAYIQAVRNTFADSRFANALSLLAYVDGQAVGRIDTSLIASRFDGTLNAYLDWICVIKSYRHAGVAQMLLREARRRLKEQGAEKLIALMAANDEAQRFYRAVENAKIHDEGIWMDL